MNLSELRTEFDTKLSGEGGTSPVTDSARKNLYINKGYKKLCREISMDNKAAGLLEYEENVELTISSGKISLPVRTMRVLTLFNSSGTEVEPTSRENRKAGTGYYYSGTSTDGNRTKYISIVSDGKSPSDGTKYYGDVIKMPVDLTSDTDKPIVDDDFHDAITDFAAFEYYVSLGREYQGEADKWLKIALSRMTEIIDSMRWIDDEPVYIGE